MRMMLKISMNVEAASRSLRDGTMAGAMQALAQEIRPEASYFTTDNGKRTAFFFFDMKDASQMPPVLEPIFQQLNAEIWVTPAMNQEELNRGLEAWGKKMR